MMWGKKDGVWVEQSGTGIRFLPDLTWYSTESFIKVGGVWKHALIGDTTPNTASEIFLKVAGSWRKMADPT